MRFLSSYGYFNTKESILQDLFCILRSAGMRFLFKTEEICKKLRFPENIIAGKASRSKRHGIKEASLQTGGFLPIKLKRL